MLVHEDISVRGASNGRNRGYNEHRPLDKKYVLHVGTKNIQEPEAYGAEV